MNELDLYDAVEIIRSKRKSYSIEIKPDLRIIMRVPTRATKKEILHILKEKASWIEKHTEIVAKKKEEAGSRNPLSEEELKELVNKAKEILPSKVEFYARQFPVTYGRITIRHQKSRWGSCSSKGNLNFNCLLMLAPDEVIDYVVVHELAHRKEMNHSTAFWQQVESILPDYKVPKKWLKDHGGAIMSRNPE